MSRRFAIIAAIVLVCVLVVVYTKAQSGQRGPSSTGPSANTAPQNGSTVPYNTGAKTGSTASADTGTQTPHDTSVQTGPTGPPLTSQSNLVLVPVLVKKGNETVFSLTAGDFVLRDDGVQQDVRVEDDTNLQPLAVAVIVETGGRGASHLHDYGKLGAVLDAVIGDVPHRVAVIGFDNVPRLEEDFTTNTDAAAETIASLQVGDHGASILDALAYGIRLLSKQPPEYRRAVLLFSETEDGGSQTTLADAIRAVDDTNTTIYSFAFSTTQQAVKHEASKMPLPGGTPYGNTPYAPGGCMDRNSDPDANGNRGIQALDCASDLLPPLRLARMAFLEARDGIRKNVPESVAQLTGGEYFGFENGATLRRSLLTVSNDLPNYYVLSFRPQSPNAGMHSLQLGVKGHPKVQLKARKAYWVDE